MERAAVPERAKKVFSGVIFDVYQWQQELFDGSFSTFELVKRRDSATVIAVHEDKVVVTREEHPTGGPFLSLPCGFLEEGELPLEAAKRELREESGMVSDSWELLVSLPVGSKVVWDEHIFVARDCRKVGDAMPDAGERIEVLSYSWEEFLSLLADGDFRLTNLALYIFRLKQKGGLEAFKERLFR